MATPRPAVLERIVRLSNAAGTSTGDGSPYYLLGLIEGVRTREYFRDKPDFTPERILAMCKGALGIENEEFEKGVQAALDEKWCSECGEVLIKGMSYLTMPRILCHDCHENLEVE